MASKGKEVTLRIDLRLDATVIAFTAALMLITILATVLAPALYASSPDLAQILGSEIVNGSDIRVIQGRENLSFPLKSRQPVVIR